MKFYIEDEIFYQHGLSTEIGTIVGGNGTTSLLVHVTHSTWGHRIGKIHIVDGYNWHYDGTCDVFLKQRGFEGTVEDMFEVYQRSQRKTFFQRLKYLFTNKF